MTTDPNVLAEMENYAKEMIKTNLKEIEDRKEAIRSYERMLVDLSGRKSQIIIKDKYKDLTTKECITNVLTQSPNITSEKLIKVMDEGGSRKTKGSIISTLSKMKKKDKTVQSIPSSDGDLYSISKSKSDDKVKKDDNTPKKQKEETSGKYSGWKHAEIIMDIIKSDPDPNKEWISGEIKKVFRDNGLNDGSVSTQLDRLAKYVQA